MMGQHEAVVSRTLPPEPRSAARARRFVADLLEQWHEDHAAEVVSLLVSELVTNAVLHAGSAVQVVARRQTGRLRIEVGDGSSVVPAARHSDPQATTGRGLDLVELLAEDWGVSAVAEAGKVVWFEVPTTEEQPGPTQPAHAADPPAVTTVGAQDYVELWLLQAPVRLMRTMQQHTEALVRELALYAFDDTAVGTPVRLDVDLPGLDRGLVDAATAGHASADINVRVHADAAAGLRDAAEQLEDADRLATEGLLLCPPALAEVAGCRRWFLEQLTTQLEGAPPHPWQPQRVAVPERPVEIDHRAVLDHLAHAVVVANDQNRITYMNAACEELLGWSAAELVGQRVTALVPERLRDAHIAGYTRLLITGAPRLLGTPVLVPARHRDGSEVDLELSLSMFRAASGRRKIVSVLRPVDDSVAPAAGPQDAALLPRMREALADSRSLPPGQRRHELLHALAARLGWPFAAWWVVDGGTLRCVATWHDDARLQPFIEATSTRRFEPGAGLPGRVWAGERAAWLTDVVADANFPRAVVGLETGLRTGCAFPLRVADRTVGVVELLRRQMLAPDHDLLARLSELGELLGDLD